MDVLLTLRAPVIWLLQTLFAVLWWVVWQLLWIALWFLLPLAVVAYAVLKIAEKVFGAVVVRAWVRDRAQRIGGSVGERLARGAVAISVLRSVSSSGSRSMRCGTASSACSGRRGGSHGRAHGRSDGVLLRLLAPPSSRAAPPCRVSGRVNASNIEGVLDACLVGAGLAVLSAWHAEGYIALGRLIQLKLKDASPKELPITAVYPTNRQILPKVKVFLAAVKQNLAERRA